MICEAEKWSIAKQICLSPSLPYWDRFRGIHTPSITLQCVRAVVRAVVPLTLQKVHTSRNVS